MNATMVRVLVRPTFGMEYLPAFNIAVEDDSGLATTEGIVRSYLTAAPTSGTRRNLQKHIDDLLQRFVDGKEEVRTIFRHDPPPKPNLDVRDQAMVMEVLYLHHVEGIKTPTAKQMVCDAFDEAEGNMDMRTVQVAFQRWADDPAFALDRVLAYAEATKKQRHSA